MGRNPVVGRQGPAYHAATIPTEGQAKRLVIKQIRSGIGHPEGLRRILKALGLKRHQAVSTLPNNASVRGMLFKVRHLIEVAPAQEK